jgi:hypothetical protein
MRSIQSSELGARLVAYDEDGTERTVFEATTNITLGLSFINKSNDDIKGGTYYDFCDVYQSEEFLLIYKLIRDDNGKRSGCITVNHINSRYIALNVPANSHHVFRILFADSTSPFFFLQFEAFINVVH